MFPDKGKTTGEPGGQNDTQQLQKLLNLVRTVKPLRKACSTVWSDAKIITRKAQTHPPHFAHIKEDPKEHHVHSEPLATRYVLLRLCRGLVPSSSQQRE